MKKAGEKQAGYKLAVGLLIGMRAMGWAELGYAGRNKPNQSALRSESKHSAPITNALLAGSEKPALSISVRLYNYAHVSRGALAIAEAEGRRILAAAGVDSVWLDCLAPGGQLQSGADHDCTGPPGEATLDVRILPPYTKGKDFSRDTDWGFAAGSDLASVFYGRIAEFAQDVDGDDSEIPVILGDAIIHELGHLLLGPGSHSPTGIMCAQWDWNYLRLALMGSQRFTPQQAEVIRAEVGRRNHFEVAGDREPER
jgi:hypothetical protein